MKTFIFTTETKVIRNNSNKETYTVYQVKNNKPEWIGQKTISRGSYKGSESEVYTLLFEKKLVSKKLYTSERGYYTPNQKEFKIIGV